MNNEGLTIQNNMNLTTQTFRVVITKYANKEYIAEIPSIKHCIASGETVEEAMSNISEVLDAMLEIMVEDDMPIPNDTNLIEYSLTKQIKTNLKLETA